MNTKWNDATRQLRGWAMGVAAGVFFMTGVMTPAWGQAVGRAEAGSVVGADEGIGAGAPLRFKPNLPEGAPTHTCRALGDLGTRSGVSPATIESGGQPSLYVLLPAQVAVTMEAQPSLFWYLSKPVGHTIRITLNASNRVEPVLSTRVDGAKVEGIQRLDLRDFAVKLQPGVEYEWVVTIQSSEDSPAQNVYAKSLLWRQDAPAELARRMSQADRRQRAVMAAEAGVWIDALAYISDLIEQRPNDASLRRDRADLLRQVDFDVAISVRDDQHLMETVFFRAAQAQNTLTDATSRPM